MPNLLPDRSCRSDSALKMIDTVEKEIHRLVPTFGDDG
jgi:hypothetical protein